MGGLPHELDDVVDWRSAGAIDRFPVVGSARPILNNAEGRDPMRLDQG